MTGRHGYGPYTNGCRCTICKQAKADYVRGRRAEARQAARESGGHLYIDGITHGRYGYEERGCRCGTCLAPRADQALIRTRKRRLRACDDTALARSVAS